MKIINLLMLLAILSIASTTRSLSCDCNQTRLTNIAKNLDVKIVASYGSNTPVASISPGTTYYLRVQPKSYYCQAPVSHCPNGGIFAPVAICIRSADGCNIYDNFVPPRVCNDVSSYNNYVTYFRITTWSGADFLSELYFSIGAMCWPGPDCGLLLPTSQSYYPYIRP